MIRLINRPRFFDRQGQPLRLLTGLCPEDADFPNLLLVMKPKKISQHADMVVNLIDSGNGEHIIVRNHPVLPVRLEYAAVPGLNLRRLSVLQLKSVHSDAFR